MKLGAVVGRTNQKKPKRMEKDTPSTKLKPDAVDREVSPGGRGGVGGESLP